MSELTERVHLPYSPAQLFDLVADVARYPQFVPWIIAARIHRRAGQRVWTEMVVGAGPLWKRFSTVATLDRPRGIRVSSYDPMFERFEQRWSFASAPGGGTTLEYHVELKLRSSLLRLVLARSFTRRAGAMVSAFIRRAHALYGKRIHGDRPIGR